MFINILFENPDKYFIWLVLVIFSICLHEYFHAQVALMQGDDTAARDGHLTLNPMKQMGPISLVLCAVIGIAFGSVPVNPSNFRKNYSRALVSFAGPFANLMLFVIFVILAALASHFNAPERSFYLLYMGATLNIVLFMFNMLPIPPLDGFEILSYFFPKIHDVKPEIINVIYVGLFFLVFACFQYLYILGSSIAYQCILLLCKILSRIL